MEEILHQFIGSSPHYSQGFIHLRWCRIAAINGRIIQWSETKTNTKYQWETQSGQTFIHPTTCLKKKTTLGTVLSIKLPFRAFGRISWAILANIGGSRCSINRSMSRPQCQATKRWPFQHQKTRLVSGWTNSPEKMMRPSNWKSSFPKYRWK